MLREPLELQVLEDDPERAAGTIGTGVGEHGASPVAAILPEASAVALRHMVAITDEKVCSASPARLPKTVRVCVLMKPDCSGSFNMSLSIAKVPLPSAPLDRCRMRSRLGKFSSVLGSWARPRIRPQWSHASNM